MNEKKNHQGQQQLFPHTFCHLISKHNTYWNNYSNQKQDLDLMMLRNGYRFSHLGFNSEAQKWISASYQWTHNIQSTSKNVQLTPLFSPNMKNSTFSRKCPRDRFKQRSHQPDKTKDQKLSLLNFKTSIFL